MNTKEKIFNVSLDLFSKKGYDSVSLREIAEEVGITKSSIYSHYPSKESILMDIFDYFTQQFEYNPIINNDKIKLDENNPFLEDPEFFYLNLARIPRLLKSRMNRNVRGTFIFNNFPYLFF